MSMPSVVKSDRRFIIDSAPWTWQLWRGRAFDISLFATRKKGGKEEEEHEEEKGRGRGGKSKVVGVFHAGTCSAPVPITEQANLRPALLTTPCTWSTLEPRASVDRPALRTVSSCQRE